MQDLGLHFFLPVNFRGIETGVADQFFGNPTCDIGAGNHGFRCDFFVRNQVDAGVGAKETDVVGIADPVTDFLVQRLNLFMEDISGLFADIGDADKYIGEEPGRK